MTEPVANKDPGWEDWLKQYGVWDHELKEEDLYLRYRKLHKLNFDTVPKDMWGRLYQDLLFFEEGLVFGNSIGLVDQFPFSFHVEDSSPLREKPIQYAKEEREWIENYLTQLETLGVVRRVHPGDKEPDFAVGAVLVRDGQSQQRFRLCANLAPVNTRVSQSAHPLNECHSSLDQLQGQKFKSALDVKAGYLNVPIKEGLRRFVGLVTQDSLFIFQRMVFGFHLAPAFFQAIMIWALRQARFQIHHGVYLDDCPVGANTWEEAWGSALEAMRCLLCIGLPINIWKCQFLQVELSLLGWVLTRDDYHLGRKAMARLFATQLPRTLQELQSLLGKLNFSSLFLTDYKKLVQPIIELMGGQSNHCWTEHHTKALNLLGRAIWERVKLTICDPKLPMILHVDAGDQFGTVALVQHREGEKKLIALASKRLLKTEIEAPQMEKLLLTALWGLKRLQKYCGYSPDVQVALPMPAEVSVCRTRDPPLRIQAKLIELSSFGVSFCWGEGALQVGEELGAALSEPPDASDTELKCPTWMHQDITVQMPGKLPSGVTKLGDLSLFFDGASGKGQIGAGGYVVLDREGSCQAIGGKFYGPKHTNNVAEARAMVDGLLVVGKLITMDVKEVVVKGDSDLVIGFMTKRFKPKKRDLTLLVKQAWEVVKSWKKVRAHFFHVPRDINQAADWMSKLARTLQGDPDLRDFTTCKRDGRWPVPPPLSLKGPGIEGGGIEAGATEQAKSLVSWESVGLEPPTCHRCRQSINTRIYECGSCARCFHGTCLDYKQLPQRLGPWHCKRCSRRFFQEGLRDILLDEQLLKYLSHQELPADSHSAARVVKAAKFASMDGDGQIWVAGGENEQWRQVPSFSQRNSILTTCLSSLGFPNGERLYTALRGQYWWHGMMADCVEAAAACLPRQQERAVFKSPRFLFPVPKPAAPFRLWAVDCLTNLTPMAPDGSADVIIAVDPFSKWVEVGKLPVLDSAHTSAWLHAEVVCRYGLPSAIRSDQGREFLGAFSRYLKLHGVLHLPIITKNPRANGQVERYVREVKKGIRLFTTSCPGGNWWEFLPDIARGLRVIPTRATGYSPFVLAFKQQPVLSFPQAIRTISEKDWELQGAQHVEELTAAWQDIFAEVRLRLQRGDEAMVRSYHRRADLADLDVRFAFKGGDLVFLRQRDPGKLKVRSMGPFIFLQYVGSQHVQAKIMNFEDKTFMVSAGNLLPVDPPATRMIRFVPDASMDPASPEFPSMDSPFATESTAPSTPRLPPGVHLEPEWADLDPATSPRRRKKRVTWASS